MKMLFNHGLTASELFSNTPEKVTTRKWRWFVDRYGRGLNRDDAVADPFKYCMFLVFNKMLDDRMRFVIPGVSESYIDFECRSEEKFLFARQCGAFPEIDFVNSDFSAYNLRYFWKAKGYQKSLPVYLGGDLKKKLIEKTNAGVKLYSVKDFTLNDLFQQISDRFKAIPKPELRRMLMFGFRRMHSAIKYGCYITMNSNRFGNCYFYIGTITLNVNKQIWQYKRKRSRKLRKIQGWIRPEFDGYYYIGMNEEEMEKWVIMNKGARKIVTFRDTMPKKIKEELYYKYPKVHIFRISLDNFKGWLFWADEIKAKDVAYLGEVNKLNVTPSDKTWKQIKKEYEKRQHK